MPLVGVLNIIITDNNILLFLYERIRLDLLDKLHFLLVKLTAY